MQRPVASGVHCCSRDWGSLRSRLQANCRASCCRACQGSCCRAAEATRQVCFGNQSKIQENQILVSWTLGAPRMQRLVAPGLHCFMGLQICGPMSLRLRKNSIGPCCRGCWALMPERCKSVVPGVFAAGTAGNVSIVFARDRESAEAVSAHTKEMHNSRTCSELEAAGKQVLGGKLLGSGFRNMASTWVRAVERQSNVSLAVCTALPVSSSDCSMQPEEPLQALKLLSKLLQGQREHGLSLLWTHLSSSGLASAAPAKLVRCTATSLRCGAHTNPAASSLQGCDYNTSSRNWIWVVHRYENALEKANYAQLAKAQEAQAAAHQAANEDDEQVRPTAFAPLRYGIPTCTCTCMWFTVPFLEQQHLTMNSPAKLSPICKVLDASISHLSAGPDCRSLLWQVHCEPHGLASPHAGHQLQMQAHHQHHSQRRWVPSPKDVCSQHAQHLLTEQSLLAQQSWRAPRVAQEALRMVQHLLALSHLTLLQDHALPWSIWIFMTCAGGLEPQKLSCSNIFLLTPCHTWSYCRVTDPPDKIHGSHRRPWMLSWPGRGGRYSSAVPRKLPGKLARQPPSASARQLRLQLLMQVGHSSTQVQFKRWSTQSKVAVQGCQSLAHKRSCREMQVGSAAVWDISCMFSCPEAWV